MAAVYAFVIAVFVYKDLKLRDVPKSLLNASGQSAPCCSTVRHQCSALFPF